MPSVAVVWKGNCRDPRIRYRLLGHLHRLAARSDEYLCLRQPARPRFLDMLNGQRTGGCTVRANVEDIDREVSGSILISTFISPHPEALAMTAREAGIRLIDPPEAKGAGLIEIEKARLRGLDFKLFDPRGIYPGADRMSFVFLECEHPFLDGRLVEIAPGEDCEGSETAAVRDADVYLCAPSVHLRYYLEDWTDCLFSWIKFFFIGDLWWHRWQEMQGYADYRQVFKELQEDRGAEAAEQAAFDAVLATFAQHAEHWIGEVEGWAKSEQP
jgi:hypothetical protein